MSSAIPRWRPRARAPGWRPRERASATSRPRAHRVSSVDSAREFCVLSPAARSPKERTRLVASRPAFDRLGHFRPSIDESARVDSKPLVGRSVSMKSATPAVTASASRAAPHSPRARDLPEQVRPRAAPPRARDPTPRPARRTRPAAPPTRSRVGACASRGARARDSAHGATVPFERRTARRGAAQCARADATRANARGGCSFRSSRGGLSRVGATRRGASRARPARARSANATRGSSDRPIRATNRRELITRRFPASPRADHAMTDVSANASPLMGAFNKIKESALHVVSQVRPPPFPRATQRRDDPPLQLSPRGRG